MQALNKIISKNIYWTVAVLAFTMNSMILVFYLAYEKSTARRDAERTFLQMEQVLEENKKELGKITKEYTLRCLHAAEAVSRIIEGEPQALYSLETLKEIALEVEVDEIHIFDGKGRIFSGTVPPYYGYTMDSGEQMSFFKPMLTDKTLKLVQGIMENTAEEKLMQYSAVWSDGGKFIVQVGMDPVNVIKATGKNGLSYIFSLFRVNPMISYYAIDVESGRIVGSNNLGVVGKECSDVGFRFGDIEGRQKGFYGKIDGQRSFCVFQKIDSNYIGRIISIKYLYQNVPIFMLSILLCLIAVSSILAISIKGCMNKYVVDKIHTVINKLKLISDGNLSEIVDVQESVEFYELSNYINHMVRSLLRFGAMEQQVNETLRLALRAGDPEASLAIILEYLGRKLGGKRVYIFEKNKTGGDDNTYEWVAEGVDSKKDELQNLPPEICEGWYKAFSENQLMIFEDIEIMKKGDPLMYENLKRQGIVSIIVEPLRRDGAIIGFFGIDDPPLELFEQAFNLLRVTGSFIEALLTIRNLMRDLKRMSYSDQLTQIGNRHALWEYIDTINEGASTGIVYCDITGLKRVNDTGGHEAGDRLILSAVECMKEALDGYELFRLGGDELLAVCSGVDKEGLWKSVDRLRSITGEHGVVLAIGAVWKSDCSEGMNSMMAEAEGLMYKDKAAYYAATGIERRR